MIQFTYLPQLVAIAIIARKFPLTALGGSLILASDNPAMTVGGFLLVGIGQYVHIQKMRKERMIREIADDMLQKMEAEIKDKK
jgi:hypothetical protein